MKGLRVRCRYFRDQLLIATSEDRQKVDNIPSRLSKTKRESVVAESRSRFWTKAAASRTLKAIPHSWHAYNHFPLFNSLPVPLNFRSLNQLLGAAKRIVSSPKMGTWSRKNSYPTSKSCK